MGDNWLCRARVAALAAVAVLALLAASSASAKRTYRPRIGGAMGIIAPAGHQDVAIGSNVRAVFHGGSVMRGVTLHTIFWAPKGYRFDGPPSAGTLSYEALIQQFFTDAAHDSGMPGNAFSVLLQYGDSSGSGAYNFSYNASSDSVDDTHPYPARSRQCPSPAGVATCVTDLEVQREIQRLIGPGGHGRGLHDLWFVFLPPDVDTCISLDQCGTNAFAGYHALSNLASPPTVYSVVVDPLIEFTPAPGADPEGNPEAETAIDVAAHEAVEAVTDPEGVGWMDPNGLEVGDKCENGPQQGTPLGYAPDGSPYNQVIGGHPYLIQTMWSNANRGCVQRTRSTSSPLPLATVDLRQFSSSVSGNIGHPVAGVPVTILLARTGTVVAVGSSATRADGEWGPAPLVSVSSSGRRAVGDDRDEILVRYGPGGPRPDLIETGDGGNPFVSSGWTGWFDLDHGYAVGSSSILLAPCWQVGVSSLAIDGAPTASPLHRCENDLDAAVVPTQPLQPGSAITMSSEDNRALWQPNPNGALIKLRMSLGEPGSVAAVGNPLIPFQPSGFPSCTADLRAQNVRCSGLVPGARYALRRRRGAAVRDGRAAANGSVLIGGFPGPTGIAGGDLLTLTNQAGRTLTALHVAHLRVDLRGRQTVIAGGTCEAGDYWGPPLGSPPLSSFATLPGAGGSGSICPLSGSARGLPAAQIEQTDDASGGQTRTEVPYFLGTAPVNDETLYGPFMALVQTGLPGPNGSVLRTRVPVSLVITRASNGQRVFRADNVDTRRGVPVKGLRRGAYLATWVLRDAGGDTRTITTHFVQER